MHACDEQGCLFVCLPVSSLTMHICVHHLQDKAQSVYDSFFAGLAGKHEEAAETELSEEITGSARAAAVQALKVSRLNSAAKLIRVVKNGQYAFVQWSPEHVKTAAEQEAWDQTYVLNKHAERNVMSKC